MVEIYVVRHGKTEFNEKSMIIGHTNVPLSSAGIHQIKCLGNKLSKIKFDAIYSSDLERAKQTAEIINSQLNSKSEIKVSKELREINYGKLSGKLKREIREKYPLYHKHIAFVNPEGESFQQLYRRVIEFLKKISPSYKKILIVTHAGCIRAIYSYCNNKKFQDNLSIKISHDFIMKCEINKNKKKATIIQN